MKKYVHIVLLVVCLASCKKADLTKVDEVFWVRNQGADMPVHIHGNLNNSIILLVVHGGPGGSGLDYRWGKYTVPLEKKYAVAYWDQRGQGMSHGKYTDADLTVDKMVSDLDAVVRVLNNKYNGAKIVVLGHSWGGTLTAKYMVSGNVHSSVSAWIESNGAHDIPKLNRDAINMFKTVANDQITLGNNISNWSEVLDWANSVDTNNISEDESFEINSKGFEAENWLTEDGLIQASESGGNEVPYLTGPVNPLTSLISGGITNFKLSPEIEQLSLTDQLYKVTIPTLVLWGRYDFVVPPKLGYDTYNNISSTKKEIVIFEKSGHSPMSNEWEPFSDAIISFIDSL
jgi:proline iminopeptidase